MKSFGRRVSVALMIGLLIVTLLAPMTALADEEYRIVNTWTRVVGPDGQGVEGVQIDVWLNGWVYTGWHYCGTTDASGYVSSSHWGIACGGAYMRVRDGNQRVVGPYVSLPRAGTAGIDTGFVLDPLFGYYVNHSEASYCYGPPCRF